MQMGNMKMAMVMSGPQCLVKNAPGQADYLAFYKAALNVLTDGSQYSFIKMLPMMPLSLYVALLTTFLGVLIGVWGSVISIRRFLKV